MNRSQAVAKISIVVPAGATLEVDAVVAAQLLAFPEFRERLADDGPAGDTLGGAVAAPSPEGEPPPPSGPAPSKLRRGRR